MKTIPYFLCIIAAAFFIGKNQALAQVPTSRMQLVNNCADINSDSFDIYIDGSILVAGLGFRTATPFMSMPGNSTFRLSVAPKHSAGPQDTFYSKQLNMDTLKTYIIVLDGVNSGAGYSPLEPVFFNVYDMGEHVATASNHTDMLFHNGSTDAPPFDVIINNTVVGDNLKYRQFSAGYAKLPTSTYTAYLTDTTGTPIYRSYTLPLQASALDGEAIAVIASGFYNPSSNSNGPAFGLFGTTELGGPLIQFPEVSTQVSTLHLNGEKIILYPNPSNSTVYLDGNVNFAKTQADVCDVTGKTMKHYNQLSSAQLDVSDLMPGVYFLRLVAENGDYSVQQFLKE